MFFYTLTLHCNIEGGAVTLVLGRHLTPVAAGVSRHRLDDLHLVSVDLWVELNTTCLLLVG